MKEHSILNPKRERVKFTALDGETYEAAVMISYPVGAFVMDNAQAFSELSGPMTATARKSYDLMLGILATMLQNQHDFMTVEWIQKNLDIQQHFLLIQKITGPLMEFLASMGYAEAAQPIKEPVNG